MTLPPLAAIGPLAPAILDEVEGYIARFRLPMSWRQYAAKIEGAGAALGGGQMPQRDLFLYAVAAGLMGLADCDRLAALAKTAGGAKQP